MSWLGFWLNICSQFAKLYWDTHRILILSLNTLDTTFSPNCLALVVGGSFSSLAVHLIRLKEAFFTKLLQLLKTLGDHCSIQLSAPPPKWRRCCLLDQ